MKKSIENKNSAIIIEELKDCLKYSMIERGV
jgi:hypothetical protein